MKRSALRLLKVKIVLVETRFRRYLVYLFVLELEYRTTVIKIREFTTTRCVIAQKGAVFRERNLIFCTWQRIRYLVWRISALEGIFGKDFQCPSTFH
jgi:hypothetical protein